MINRIYPDSPIQKTQHQMLTEHFQAGGSLTVLEAIQQYGCYALSQRVGELKKPPFNLDIVTEMVEIPSGKRIARYHKKR